MKKAVLFLVFLIIFGFTLTSCGEPDIRQTTVEEFLTLYQSKDESAGTYLYGQTEDQKIKFEGIQALLAQNMTFTVGGAQEKDEKNFVEVKIQNIDFRSVFETTAQEVDENIPEEDILGKLQEGLKSNSAPRKEFDVDILLEKDGEDYKIVMDGELSNALLGGYNEYITLLTGEMVHE